MKLAEYKTLLIHRSNDFIKDNMCGIVLKTPEEIGKNMYGVFISRLMMGTINNNGPMEESIKLDANLCLNSINTNIGSSTVITSNFINLTMHSVYNLSMPRLILGEKVTIGVVDQDIKSLYIKPFERDQIQYRPNDILEMYVPASGTYNGDDMTDDNKYYIKLDSLSENIRIHMSNAQSEISKYDILMDGVNGALTLTDGKRSITIDTQNDRVFMVNEANSTISLKENMIDILTSKLYIKASESITIESPKMVGTIDEIELNVSNILKGSIDKIKIEGSKLEENYSNTIINNDKRKITSPTTMVEGLMTVSGYICPGGIGFGAPSTQNPLPVNPQVSSQGIANFAGPAGMPLAKATPLLQLLTVMATQLDAVSSAPVVPVPPMAIVTLTSLMSQIMSISVKG